MRDPCGATALTAMGFYVIAQVAGFVVRATKPSETGEHHA